MIYIVSEYASQGEIFGECTSVPLQRGKCTICMLRTLITHMITESCTLVSNVFESPIGMLYFLGWVFEMFSCHYQFSQLVVSGPLILYNKFVILSFSSIARFECIRFLCSSISLHLNT
jgi:hypothetical protein